MFDVRAFNPTAKRYVNQERKSSEVNEKEKKKQYKERILQVKHGTFTALVISATGGMGRESRKFYALLSEVISKKRKGNYAFIASWIRRKSFPLANSLCTRLRGSRSIYYSSNTYSKNALSSFAKASEVMLNVDGTLLSFSVLYIS